MAKIAPRLLLALVVNAAVVADCPDPIPPFPMEQVTVDGITHSMGVYKKPGKHIYASYFDNRTSVKGVFFSHGFATVGHIEIFQDHIVLYSMSVDLPDGNYVLVNNRDGLHSHEYDLCAKDGKVILHIEDGILGPDHHSYVWNFEIYIDIQGDINNDGVVGGMDLGILLSHWGTGHQPSDLNSDGIVDSADLTILLAHWTH